MRRIQALVILLAWGMSQQAANACPMDRGDTELAPAAGHVHGRASHSNPGSHADQTAQVSHTAHATHADPARDAHSRGPGGSCRLLVACAGAALAAAEPTVTRVDLREAAVRRSATTRARTKNFPQNDTPPPRLRV